MNAAARVYVQSITLPRSPLATFINWLASPYAIISSLLILLIISSAIGIITLSDQNRQLMGQTNSLTHQAVHLKTTYNQLLLEKNTWAAPQRIAFMATRQLAMQQPTPTQIIIIPT